MTKIVISYSTKIPEYQWSLPIDGRTIATGKFPASSRSICSVRAFVKVYVFGRLPIKDGVNYTTKWKSGNQCNVNMKMRLKKWIKPCLEHPLAASLSSWLCWLDHTALSKLLPGFRFDHNCNRLLKHELMPTNKTKRRISKHFWWNQK